MSDCSNVRLLTSNAECGSGETGNWEHQNFEKVLNENEDPK